MMFRTHIIFALFFFLLFMKIFSFNFPASISPIIFALVICFGSILPDVDSPGSFVNRKYLFGIGQGISAFSEHRGFFHSIFGILLFAVIAFVAVYFIKTSFIYAIALPIGYFLHLAADSFTVSGINWLWKSGHIKGPITTGSIFEQFFFIALLIATVYIAIGNQGLQQITASVSKIKP